ncbi:MAG: peptidoglycan-binding domain-containing protein [Phycisphaerales bacterium]
MTLRDILNSIARLHSGSSSHNTFNIRTIEIFLQKSAGVDEGDDRGIEGLAYRVTSDGNDVLRGTTEADGKIAVPFRPNTAMVLELLHEGNPVARYNLHINQNPFEPDSELIGLQRRFRQLGYQLGNAGDARDGIDGEMGRRTDKAIQDFQIDAGLAFDSVAGDNTKAALNDAVGGSAQNG